MVRLSIFGGRVGEQTHSGRRIFKECRFTEYAVELKRPKWATAISKMQLACMCGGDPRFEFIMGTGARQ
jgi:hypothetical protein